MNPFLDHLRKWWKVHVPLSVGVALSILALAGAFATGKALVSCDSVSCTVRTKDSAGNSKTVTVPASVVAKSNARFPDKSMKTETPAAAPKSVIENAREQQDALAASDQLPLVTPDAAPSQRGCTSNFVVNYSSRRGVRPRLFVLHYTVSANRAGWSDVNAIVALFNTVAFQASSNYVIDGEGNCAYIVRESDKAWTQAALNPVAISVEVINSGHESIYAGPAGLKKIALVVSDALRRWQIPVQLGAVSNGVVTRAGIVDHAMLGVAGGGHHDINPFKVAPVIAAVKALRAQEARKARPTRAQLRAKARAVVLSLRAAGASWPLVKASPEWKSYLALGGK
jgi:hypothetical protein